LAITTSRASWTGLVGKQSKVQDFLVSRLKIYTIKVTVGASDNYVTGGLAVSLKDVGLTSYVAVIPFNPSGAVGIAARYDTTNEKILLYTSNGAAPALLAELANASTATNNMTIEFLVIGQ